VTIEQDVAGLWERRTGMSENDLQARSLVGDVLDALDRGEVRVAEVGADGEIVVHEWVRQAILLSFRLLNICEVEVGPYVYRDRIPLKKTFDNVRVVPGAIARWGSYCAPGVVLMPSFVNIGGYVDEGTMVDTWATVGSCAQIGKRVHLAGGVGIGGVLEPPNAVPVVVEDDAFIGSRSMVVDGARVRRGAKLGAGCILTSSTHVYDAETGEELPRGEAPERAVCVGSSRLKSFPGGEFGMPCLLVLRYLDGTEHDKLQLNDVLRRHGVAT
jgi:2,3,4,5-tetrahydropyridine-2-carboxylate N-succinyltransferase